MFYLKSILYLFVLLQVFTSSAQDTVFVRSLPIDSIVQNIDSDGKELFIRTKSTLYSWRNEKMEFLNLAGLKFSILEHSEVHNSYVINEFQYLPSVIRDKNKGFDNILPGKSNRNTTSARIGNNLYVCFRGKVLQYKINPHFRRIHSGISIRHIFSEPKLRIISTYSGIFIDTNRQIFSDFCGYLESKDKYSNGVFIRIDSNYYLCQDNLLKYAPETHTFESFITTDGVINFRKLIKFNNKTYGLFNMAFGEIDLRKKKALSYLITDNLTDCEVFQDKLYVGTEKTTLYQLDKNHNVKKIHAKHPITTIAKLNNELFIGTTKGLLILKDSILKECIPELEIVDIISLGDNIIISNNDGLYFWDGNNVRELLSGIEFNKHALTMDKHYLYAGSVEGLFAIKKADLISLIKSKKKTEQITEGSFLTLSDYLLIFLFVTIAIYLYLKLKNKNKNELLSSKKVFTSHMVKEVILNNPQIISVEEIANYLNTSVVQINRHLKKEGVTCLKVVKEAKKQIAQEMHNDGKTLEEIASRTGYSTRYVKTNFLRQ